MDEGATDNSPAILSLLSRQFPELSVVDAPGPGRGYEIGAAITGVLTVVLDAVEPDISLMSAFTAVAATINNIGPGLDAVGPVRNFAFFDPAAKWLLSLCMVMGRLEYMSILVLFAPRFWLRD